MHPQLINPNVPPPVMQEEMVVEMSAPESDPEPVVNTPAPEPVPEPHT